MRNAGCGWSITAAFCFSFLLTHFPCSNIGSPKAAVLQDEPAPVWILPTGCSSIRAYPTLVWSPPWVQCGYLLHHGLSRGCEEIPAPVPGAPPPLPPLTSIVAGLFLALLPSLLSSFLPFLTHIFPEAPPSWLRGSAMSCGWSAGAGCDWLFLTWGSPSISSQRWPCSHPKTNTWAWTHRAVPRRQPARTCFHGWTVRTSFPWLASHTPFRQPAIPTAGQP